MKRKQNGTLLIIVAVIALLYFMRNESVLKSLGPLGDFLSSHGEISAIIIGVVVLVLGGKEYLRRRKIDYQSTEGTVCWVSSEQNSHGEKARSEDRKYTVRYTVDSQKYEKTEFMKQGQYIREGAKFIVYYNPQNPNDSIIKRVITGDTRTSDFFLGGDK